MKFIINEKKLEPKDSYRLKNHAKETVDELE